MGRKTKANILTGEERESEASSMSARAAKSYGASATEESSLSDSVSGREDETTIPFLRRLRDMLKENENVISFIPGRRNNDGTAVLGRIVVHDRIQVEAVVLPRYFNHSSFASLRRQLNYFSFARLGKGRQLESTYINDAVVELDDMLHLKRRPVGNTPSSVGVIDETKVPTRVMMPRTNAGVELMRPKKQNISQSSSAGIKRRRIHTLASLSQTPLVGTTSVISEDEQSEGKRQYIALDLTEPCPEDDVLAGCTALLGLSTKVWVAE